MLRPPHQPLRDGRPRTSAATAAPFALFDPHRARPYAFLLDRAGIATPSFAGSQPTSVLVVDPSGQAWLSHQGEWRREPGEPLDAIARFVDRSHIASRPLPKRWNAVTIPRTVGYLAYELGSFIENVPRLRADPIGAPLALLATYDRCDAWDPTTGEIVHLRMADPSDAVPPPTGWPLRPRGAAANEAGQLEAYRRGFARIMRAIRAGEIYQANLSRALRVALADEPAELYARLRARQPVAHGAFVDLGTFQILSNSPECFLRVHDDEVRTFPIKGTRPRGATVATDRALAAELAADPKELAEHLMIVDLERNDLGRVCEIGSVCVPEYARVQSFATLHHMVSEVGGRLRAECSLADLLRATFPGGSITGAPKIQSMRTIAEVETSSRGIYTGAIGCFNGARQIDLNVAIRTAVVADGYIHYRSGGGIVADSEWGREYDETVTKAAAFLDATNPRDRHRAAAS